MNDTNDSRRKLFVLDVGHGNCTVVSTSVDEVVVIDIGRSHTLLEFLSEQNIKKVKTVYISHADEDHIGGLHGLLTATDVTVEKVVLNCDSMKETKVWDDVIYELDRAHFDGTVDFCIGLVSGHVDCQNGVEIRTLGPSHYLAGKGAGSKDRSGRRITSNSISAVIRVSVSGRQVAILPGDLDKVGLDDLLNHVEDSDLQADVLVFPHHGSLSEPTTTSTFVQRLLSAISPNAVIFSIGRGHYRTPNPQLIGVLRETMPNTRIICTQLSTYCSNELPVNSMEHLNNVFSLGREDQKCCGGSIAIPLDSIDSIEPGFDEHLKFIQSSVETPLCLRSPELRQ